MGPAATDGVGQTMGERLLLTAAFAALAGLLLHQEQAALLLGPVREGLTWASRGWPALAGQDLEPLLEALPGLLAAGLLLVIPIIWLKPH
jgi:hypothetical protein